MAGSRALPVISVEIITAIRNERTPPHVALTEFEFAQPNVVSAVRSLFGNVEIAEACIANMSALYRALLRQIEQEN